MVLFLHKWGLGLLLTLTFLLYVHVPQQINPSKCALLLAIALQHTCSFYRQQAKRALLLAIALGTQQHFVFIIIKAVRPYGRQANNRPARSADSLPGNTSRDSISRLPHTVCRLAGLRRR
ncbi:hypothetical protein B0T25DRAFT_322055 [Lasiosphaeria hispida]|uniref:Secreted protein n=1 Tax=Lasiosphaeria hispida TaxID=260671 RepID=A0AAJ0H9G3_9PEZI|nr:hypothetical protein B0T25DRAFT_322055 [Lasiosphaeria hispida]